MSEEMSEDMLNDMSEEMSEDMSEDMSIEMPKKWQKGVKNISNEKGRTQTEGERFKQRR